MTIERLPDRIIRPLHGLRFIAAMTVVMSHGAAMMLKFNGPAPIWHQMLHNLSTIGMTLFFVLSGFVIHYSFSEKINSSKKGALYNFYISRFARLYPLFIFVIIFDLIIKYSYSQFPPSFFDTIPYYIFMVHSWFYAIYEGAYGQSALIYQYGVMPQVTWSISTEWFFYCSYPLILFVLNRIKRARHIIFTIFSLSLFAYASVALISSMRAPINDWAVMNFGPSADFFKNGQDSFYRWIFHTAPYTRVLEFMMGCLMASLYMRLKDVEITDRERKLGLVLTVSAIVANFTLFLLLNIFPSYVPIPQPIMAAWALSFGKAPATALLIFCCARYDTVIARWLSKDAMFLGGELSYSIYLLHLTMVMAFRWETPPVLSTRILIGDLLRYGFMLAATVGVSVITYRYLELPAKAWIVRVLRYKGEAATKERAVTTAAP
jgi:peptidoglycan/LPS O-acetylase OafA/YrhL